MALSFKFGGLKILKSLLTFYFADTVILFLIDETAPIDATSFITSSI